MYVYIDYTNAHAISYTSLERPFLDGHSGSLYLDEEVSQGYFIDTALKNKVQSKMKYDAYNDVFKIYPNGTDEGFKLLERTKRFEYEYGGERFVLIESDLLNVDHFEHGKGYVVELTSSEEEAVLYKRYHKKFDPGSVATSSYENDIIPSFNFELFYIIKLEDEFAVAKAHKKRILDVFPKDKRDDLRGYIDSQRLKFRGTDEEIENQLIQLVTYYNAL